MTQADELFEFVEDDKVEKVVKEEFWSILIVDDESDVHHVTEFALQGVVVFNKKLEFLHAYSKKEGLDILRKRKDICIVLLDVVMETPDAGLEMAREIREELKLDKIRIILRTGQPGQVPEVGTITQYDINDYKTKSELTRTRLLTTIIASLRSWQQINKIDLGKRGLEKIVQASNKLMETHGLADFAEGVIEQLAAFFNLSSEGLLCIEDCGNKKTSSIDNGCKVIAATGGFRKFIDKKTSDICEKSIIDDIKEAFVKKQNILHESSFTLFFTDPENSRKFVSWIGSKEPIRQVDKSLMEIFCKNIALCAQNIDLIEILKSQAWEDSLLHIPNLAALTNKLSAVENISDKCPCIIALVDINHFGQINDFFGHDYGDLLLKKLNNYFHNILDNEIFICRLSADVFGLIGKDSILNEKILRQLTEASLSVEEGLHQITCSIGYAIIKDKKDAIEALKNSSIALKRAKTEGLAKLVKYTENIGDKIRTRNKLLVNLRSAFKARELFLVFQPQFSVTDRSLLGFEALLRWKNKKGEYVSPEIFIPLAEQGGLMPALGLWVLEESLRAIQKLASSGYTGLRMAVNISLVQFAAPDFLYELEKALNSSGVDPSILELEITESVSAIGMEDVLNLLDSIKKMGISLAVDDFGTGYSSLSTIQEWPMDRLKIDRSFILKMNPGDGNTQIINMVIPFSRTLGMRTLAEGVETEEQFKLLKEMGCEEVQGYLLARPMAMNELIKWLGNRRE